MRISIELVPRSVDSLCTDLHQLRRYPDLVLVNVPEQERFAVRALDAVHIVRAHGHDAIAHVRSGTLHERELDALAAHLHAACIDEVLIVHGDDAANGFDPPTCIRRLRERLPGLACWAALDPWRDGPGDLEANLERKRAAGTAGFFTQPLFELAHAERIAQLLGQDPVFRGIAPVVRDASRRHWERMAGVRFPADFRLDLRWQCDHARNMLAFARDRGDHAYLMPVRTPLAAYLDGVFGADDSATGGSARQVDATLRAPVNGAVSEPARLQPPARYRSLRSSSTGSPACARDCRPAHP